MSRPLMILDRATEGDLDAILALERTGFVPSSRWIDTSWLTELSGIDRFAPAARDDSGALVGVAAFRLVAEVADLNRVVVDPSHRGRGIGRRLVEAGSCWALAQGGERLLLEVELTNEPALGLYRRLGFVGISHRPNYYGAGRDALVLQKELNA